MQKINEVSLTSSQQLKPANGSFTLLQTLKTEHPYPIRNMTYLAPALSAEIKINEAWRPLNLTVNNTASGQNNPISEGVLVLKGNLQQIVITPALNSSLKINTTADLLKLISLLPQAEFSNQQNKVSFNAEFNLHSQQLQLPQLKAYLSLSPQQLAVLTAQGDTKLQLEVKSAHGQLTTELNNRLNGQLLLSGPISTQKLMDLLAKALNQAQINITSGGKASLQLNNNQIELNLKSNNTSNHGWQPINASIKQQQLLLSITPTPITLNLNKAITQQNELRPHNASQQINQTLGAQIPLLNKNATAERATQHPETQIEQQATHPTKTNEHHSGQVSNTQDKATIFEQAAEKISQLSKAGLPEAQELNKLINQAFSRLISPTNLSPYKIQAELLKLLQPSTLSSQQAPLVFENALSELLISLLTLQTQGELTQSVMSSNRQAIDQLIGALFAKDQIDFTKAQQQLTQLPGLFTDLAMIQSSLQQNHQQLIQQLQDNNPLLHLFLPMHLMGELKQTHLKIGHYQQQEQQQNLSKTIWFIRLNFDFGTEGQLQAHAQLFDKTANFDIIASTELLSQKAEPHLLSLRQRLTEQGLKIEKMTIKYSPLDEQNFYNEHSIINIKV